MRLGRDHQMPVVVGIAIEDRDGDGGAGKHQVIGIVFGVGGRGFTEEATLRLGGFDEFLTPGRPEVLHRRNDRSRVALTCWCSYTKSCILAGLRPRSPRSVRPVR